MKLKDIEQKCEENQRKQSESENGERKRDRRGCSVENENSTLETTRNDVSRKLRTTGVQQKYDEDVAKQKVKCKEKQLCQEIKQDNEELWNSYWHRTPN